MNKNQILLTVKLAALVTVVSAATVALTPVVKDTAAQIRLAYEKRAVVTKVKASA